MISAAHMQWFQHRFASSTARERRAIEAAARINAVAPTSNTARDGQQRTCDHRSITQITGNGSSTTSNWSTQASAERAVELCLPLRRRDALLRLPALAAGGGATGSCAGETRAASIGGCGGFAKQRKDDSEATVGCHGHRPPTHRAARRRPPRPRRRAPSRPCPTRGRACRRGGSRGCRAPAARVIARQRG
jgi:hypothetical protein